MTPAIQTPEHHEAIFNYIQLLWIGDENVLRQFSSKLPSTAPKAIGELYDALLPFYDIEEPRDELFHREELDQTSDSDSRDKEHFPRDLPGNFIAELIHKEKRKHRPGRRRNR